MANQRRPGNALAAMLFFLTNLPILVSATIIVGGGTLLSMVAFFFGMESLMSQTVMTALLALLIFSELLVVIVIDGPFTGAVKVHPTALTEVLADVQSQPDESR